MNVRKRLGGFVLAALLALLASSSANAGPYLGEWDWLWHPAHDCGRGDYSPLHYWGPTFYQLRAQVRPVNVDQYTPGTMPPTPPSYEFDKHRCQSVPPIPLSPYTNPEAYYGRPVAPPR